MAVKPLPRHEQLPQKKISMTPFGPHGQEVFFGLGVDDNERLFRAVMAQGVLKDIKAIKRTLVDIRSGIGKTNGLLEDIAKILKKSLK